MIDAIYHYHHYWTYQSFIHEICSGSFLPIYKRNREHSTTLQLPEICFQHVWREANYVGFVAIQKVSTSDETMNHLYKIMYEYREQMQHVPNF